MKRTIWCSYVGLLLVGMLASPVVAQSNETQTETPAATNTSVADLKITPRFGVGHTSSGAGFDGFTRFSGFVPLLQNPGNNLTFLDGRFFLDNSANGGGNILLGHRFYSQQANRLFGGYIAYDTRDTGNSIFHQLGVGLESLGEVWDVHLNGYIPIGDRRQVVDENFINTDFQLTNSFFEDHFLITQGRRQGRVIRHQEAAMTGLDLEIGAKLAQLGDQGDLRGYGGLYWYDASGSPEILGWRLRLEARPSDTLNLGLSVQDDYLFGTNVVFTIGATFPGTRPSGVSNPESVLARMGESVVRTANITVDSQQELDSFNEAFTAKAINPETGEPYFFQHVELGSTGGNGTFENPFGQVRDALSVAQTDQIVYVQFGTNPGIMGGVNFVIPDGVSVLSTGPVQEINTVNLGLVQLPLSGTGRLPDVMDTVTMGNNTTLSGFAITSANGFGIDASDVTNVVIRDNQVTNSRERGISLENVTGVAVITNNSISKLRGTSLFFPSFSGQGILVKNARGNVDVAILSNQILDNNTSGITVEGDGNSNQYVSITNNTINGNSGSIEINSYRNANQEINISSNTIQGNVNGIRVIASGNADQEFTLSRNNIIDIGFEDNSNLIFGDDAILINATDDSIQEFMLTQNTIGDIFWGGSIEINAGMNSIQDFTITENIISNTFELNSSSIEIHGHDNSKQKFIFSDNTIRDLSQTAITITANDITNQQFNFSNNMLTNINHPSKLSIIISASNEAEQEFTVSNIISDNSGGLIVNAFDDTYQEFTLHGNTITDIDSFGPTVSGISVNASDNANQEFTLSDNSISNIFITNLSGDLILVNGISINASGNTNQGFTLSNNNISNSSGIFIGNSDNGDIAAEVRLNTITDSDFFGFIAEMNSADTFCLDLSDNTSETGFLLIKNLGTFQLINLTNIPADNTGSVFVFPDVNSFDSVPTCP